MAWRDGCAPRPPVAEGAEPVDFDFSGADLVGERLDALRRHIESGLQIRAGAQVHLTDWAGGHRREYDELRRTQEGVLTGADIGSELARLRAAWDEAAAAQVRANHRAEELAPAR
jgi:hypothetical protein